nr:GGDEF domain-containing phosphodiesterase [Treponema sp.]
MTFEKSFYNFVQILSEDEVTPEISPGALSDIAKEFSLRSIVAIVSIVTDDDSEKDSDKTVPLFGPVPENEAPAYLFRHGMAGRKLVTYNVFLYGNDKWSEEKYNSFSVIINILAGHFERFLLSKVVEKSALTHYLTGFPNSGGFFATAAKIMENGEIMQYDSFYFNLKSYGLINRRYGQNEGDEIMKRYAEKLKEFRGDDEVIGHLGGDNYVALIKKERTKEFLKLLSGVKVYGYKNEKKENIKISAVAGVYAVDDSLKNPGQLVSRAAMACSYAKNVANKPYVFVNKAMSTRIYRQKQIENHYEEALANDEFRVYLQPKVDTITGEIVGAEALARWFYNGNVLYPTEFVPILEQEGMVASLDLYILRKTCELIKEWIEKDLNPVPVSVNFSRRDLGYKNLAREVVKIVDETGIDHKYIEIEVTETSSEDERIMMTAFLSKLREANISTSIDDFGTGFSSLSTLRDFPVKMIKIDRSFINTDILNRNDEIVLKNIISMAKDLGIGVIAEGVEREDQSDLLKKVGCHIVQGFLFDNPMLPKDYLKRLEKR